jgi:threonyl-tRNA synthetase
VYRYERSGVLHGLLRVRGLTMDDGHLFVREEDIADEIMGCLKFSLEMLKLFGFENFNLYLATRPESYLGELAAWEKAESALRAVLESIGRPFEVDVGGGAFYGPKIDLKIKDALGREWQCSTFQLDYQIPARFELEYVGQDGTRKRPIMIHRALLGSMERFIAVLIEHYAGAFPLWLAPVQARVLTVSDKAEAYALEVAARLKQEGLRIETDLTADKLGAKIRKATLEKIPYQVVVGEKDLAGRVVSPRTREGQQQPATPLEEFARRLAKEAAVPVVGGAA